MNITATAPNGQIFTRKAKVVWTHAVIKTYANGTNVIHWAKTLDAAYRLHATNAAYVASLTAAQKADLEGPTQVTLVATELA